MVHYSLDALRSAGISDIALVIGYQAEKILEAFEETQPDLTFVHNEHYLGGNALSVYAARSFVSDEPFVVCMGDHPISGQIVRSLLSHDMDGCVLCVDLEACHPSQVNDATRVLLDRSSRITAIGKRLNVWNATDIGVFKMTGDVFTAAERLMEYQGTQVSITDVVTLMVDEGYAFATCDVSGMFWADVDTQEDYLSVDSLLRDGYGERV